MRWTTKLAVATVCTGVIVLPIVWLLAARMPNVVKIPLVEPNDALEPVPLELSYLDYPGQAGAHTAAMVMQQQRPESLAAHRQIDLLVGTFDTSPQLLLATLSVEGTGCRFESRRGAAYPNNGSVGLLRSRECDRMSGTPTGRLRLEVKFAGPGRIGLWTYRAPAGPMNSTVIYVPDPTYAEQGVLCILRADYVDDFGWSNRRRVDLLAYVWQLGGPTWIWTAIVTSSILLVLAVFISPHASARFGTARMAIAAGAATLAITALYVVLVPPFQGPDEPSHFLGYAYVTENPAAAAEAERWARLTHFQRLRFNPNEQFHAADIAAPYHATWDKVSTQDFARSSVSVRLWRSLSSALRIRSVPKQFLELRVLNAAIFSLSALLLAAGLWAGGYRNGAALIGLPLFIPTVPFLAMHVSNYGPATAAYLLIAGGVGLLVVDTEGAALAGLLLGAGGALALASTHSALPMIVVLATAAVFRMLIGSPAEWKAVKRVRSALVFWIGLGAGIVLLTSLVTEWQALRYQQEFERAGPWLIRAYRFAAVHDTLVATAAIIIGATVELICGVLRSGAITSIDRQAGLLRRLCRIAALAVSATLVLSLFIPMPELHPATPHTTMALYITQALASSATMLRLRYHDPLLAVSFWSGLGWLDTIPPYVTTLLSGATGLAAIVALGRVQSPRRMLWLAVTAVAVLGVVALYAAAALRLSPDLHGRYVLGGYLTGVYAVWLSAGANGPAHPTVVGLRSGLVGGFLAVLAMTTNAIALATTLTRYF